MTTDVTPAVTQNNTDAPPAASTQSANTSLMSTPQDQPSNVPAQDAVAKPEGVNYTDFTMPENMVFKSELLDKFKGMAKELSLSQPNAQKLVDIASEHAKSLQEAGAAKWENIRENWISELKTDKEFGGDKFGETVERAQRALKSYGSDSFKQFLNDTGYGDNSELVKLLARVDKATSEDRMVDGAPALGSTKSAADVLYGSTKN